MNKLYDYIVNNFINTHVEFKKYKGGNFEDGIRMEYKVNLYIDQIHDYNDPWDFTYDEIAKDVSNKDSKNIVKSSSPYWKSYNILLSNYGLSKEELPIVYEMIQRELLKRLEELNKTLKGDINESYSLDDKKEFFYEYVAKILYYTHTEIYEDEIYEDEEGIFFVYKGISHQLISDCKDFQDVVTLPFDPERYPIDRKISEVMSSLGVTNIEEQREVYQFYLDILKDKYCLNIP